MEHERGEYVNQARRAAGLSQRELSRRTGVPQSAIARIERGQQVPRADTLEKLLKACGFELRLGPARGGGVDLSQIDEWLALSARGASRTSAPATAGSLERIRSARPGVTRRSIRPARFRALNRYGVRYVVIGGLAERVPRGRDRHQRHRHLLRAHAGEHGPSGPRHSRSSMPRCGWPAWTRSCRSSSTGAPLAAGDSFTFRTDAGDLDVLGTPSGTGGFRDLDAGATSYDLGDGLHRPRRQPRRPHPDEGGRPAGRRTRPTSTSSRH